MMEVLDNANKIESTFNRVKDYYNSGATLPLSFRINALTSLENSISLHEDAILEALKEDLNKSKTEAYMTEIGSLLGEIKYMKKHIRKLARPRRRIPSIAQIPGTLKVQYEPYGVALIIAPWNYPFLITLAPLVNAIAAGNCAIIKPSAYSPATAAIIEKICKEAFHEDYVAVITGGREENSALLNMKFDYIFFTGSPEGGKRVMEQAAKNLIPVTLELGGKSPCIVDDTADIEKTAKRIVFGKLANSGQTCIAPDYLLVKENVKDRLIKAILHELSIAIPDQKYFTNSFPKIINTKHFNRLVSLLDDVNLIYPEHVASWDKEFLENHNGKLVRLSTNQIFPVLIDEPALDTRVMNEEIFGPILPILTWKDEFNLLEPFKKMDKPLALYIFSNEDDFITNVLNGISSGGVCINDTLLQIASQNTPFGGVGKSGIGSYHGKTGFYTFSHERTILKKWWLFDLPIRHHPYKERNFLKLKRLLK